MNNGGNCAGYIECADKITEAVTEHSDYDKQTVSLALCRHE